jgi:ketosteroid isomerase-like protein
MSRNWRKGPQMSDSGRLVTDTSRTMDRFFKALEKGDLSEVLGCYTENAYIWHNFDQVVMTPQQNIEQLKIFFEHFATREYLDVRRAALPDGGLVQQHLLRMVRQDGRTIDWPGCILFRFQGPKIARLEEYVDMSSFLQKMS